MKNVARRVTIVRDSCKQERRAQQLQEVAALHWTIPRAVRLASAIAFEWLFAMIASVLAIGVHVFFRDVVDLSGILAGMIATSIGLAIFATASLILRNRLRCAGLQVTLDGIAEHNPLRTARLWRFTDIARIDTMGETVWIVTHNNIERLGSLRAGSQLSASIYRDVEAIARALRDEVAQRQGLHQADFLFTDAERITLRRRVRLGTAAGLLLGAIAVFVRWRWNL